MSVGGDAAAPRPHVRFDVSDDDDDGEQGSGSSSSRRRSMYDSSGTGSSSPASSSSSPLASAIVALTARLRANLNDLVSHRIADSIWARSVPLTSLIPSQLIKWATGGRRSLRSLDRRPNGVGDGEDGAEEGEDDEWWRALDDIRARPLTILTLALWLVLLGVLGLAPIPEVPINDKVLHFVGMGTATFLLYFVLDIDAVQGPHADLLHHAPLALTLLCGFIGGGILSEIVQGMLPYKTFDFKDVIANLLGSSLALFAARHLDARARSSSTRRGADYEAIDTEAGP